MSGSANLESEPQKETKTQQRAWFSCHSAACTWCGARLTEATTPCDSRCSIPIRTSSWSYRNDDAVWGKFHISSDSIWNLICERRSGQTTVSLWRLDFGGSELDCFFKKTALFFGGRALSTTTQTFSFLGSRFRAGRRCRLQDPDWGPPVEKPACHNADWPGFGLCLLLVPSSTPAKKNQPWLICGFVVTNLKAEPSRCWAY